MKGYKTASIFVPTKAGLHMFQAGVIALLGALIAAFAAQICKNIGVSTEKTSVTFEGDSQYAGVPGFWVHVTSEFPGFTGPVTSYIDALVKTGMTQYYEIVAALIAKGNPKAEILACRGLITPEPSGILSVE
jgi:hypothetical protein